MEAVRSHSLSPGTLPARWPWLPVTQPKDCCFQGSLSFWAPVTSPSPCSFWPRVVAAPVWPVLGSCPDPQVSLHPALPTRMNLFVSHPSSDHMLGTHVFPPGTLTDTVPVRHTDCPRSYSQERAKLAFAQQPVSDIHAFHNPLKSLDGKCTGQEPRCSYVFYQQIL